MKLDSKKLGLVLIGLLALSVLAFMGITVGGLSALKSKSNTMVELKAKSQTAEAQLANLEQAKKDVEKYSFFKAVAKSVIPADKDQAKAVLEINQMAAQAGISIQTITFPASTLGLRAATSPAPQDATSSSSTAAAISQAKPVSGIPGLYSLELTITPESGVDVAAAKQVTYPKMLDFLSRIENNRRTAQITEVNIQPEVNQQVAGVAFTMKINIFIKP